MIALFVLICDRLQLDGLLFVPSHFHIAAHGRKTMRFLSPVDEGLYRALEQSLQPLSFAEAAAAVATGRVIDTATGQPLIWHPAPMVFPVSERLREQVTGEEYERRVAEEVARHAFVPR